MKKIFQKQGLTIACSCKKAKKFKIDISYIKVANIRKLPFIVVECFACKEQMNYIILEEYYENGNRI